MRHWIVLLCAFMRLDTTLSKSDGNEQVLGFADEIQAIWLVRISNIHRQLHLCYSAFALAALQPLLLAVPKMFSRSRDWALKLRQLLSDLECTFAEEPRTLGTRHLRAGL